MYQYRTPIVLGLSLVAISALAANNGANTLPIAKHLKDNNSDAVSYFRSNPLITDQGNKATGEQTLDLYVKPGSKFSIKAEGNVISPGTSATLKKQVDEDGILSFSIAPAEANVEGKTNYEVHIAEIYSNADRFWSPHSPTYTSWTDTGSNVGHSVWAPVLEQQTESFTQSRDYYDVYERQRQDREIDGNVGEVRNVGGLVTETDNRKQSETRNIIAISTNYINIGGHYACETWAPLASETYQGLTVDQSRPCSQNQTRTWTYTTGGTDIGSYVQPQTIGVTEEQTVRGTLDPWIYTTPDYSSWVNDGAGHTYTTWTPGVASQIANFVQSRTFKQPEKRLVQPREKNAVSGVYRDVGVATTGIRTIDQLETRTVLVTVGGYVNNGGVYSCSGWTPSTSSRDKGTRFTQSRNCKQKQTRTWSYKVGSTSIGSRKQDRVIDTRPTRTATGTKITNGTWVVFAEVQNTPPAVHSMVKQYLGNLSFNLYSGNDCKPYNGKTYCMSTVRRDPPSTCKVGDRYGYMTSQYPFGYGKVQECK